MRMRNLKSMDFADCIRKFLLAWLFAAALEYTLIPAPLTHLSAIGLMSLPRLLIITASVFTILILGHKFIAYRIERWCIIGCFLWLSVATLLTSFTPAYLFACLLITAVLICYALRGRNDRTSFDVKETTKSALWKWLTIVLAVSFFAFVSIWTVCRVLSFSTPTYDFGIFSQMFHSMKTTGIPLTTLERDGLLSHFKVHMSPIYYLLLPVYWCFPRPETLQVLQAAVLASAAIPLWLLCKRNHLNGMLRCILCALLLLYPAYSGGTSYDIHENAFLTPLILWLFYALDSRLNVTSVIFTLLVLMVKEDAAVYCAVIALYVIVRSLLSRQKRDQLVLGCILLTISLVWFFAVTRYLSRTGDGVMTYRYDNFIYDGSSSLFTVIKAVFLSPMKAVYECVDTEKLKFIFYTLFPLLGIPLLTRKYERYLLLIPYILVNLMSDYQYQHDIFFQYTYGSTAFLFYLTVINVADLKFSPVKYGALSAAVAVSCCCFIGTVIPKAVPYPRYCRDNSQYYEQVRNVLDTIPDNASVCATTFYTTYLSQRDVLYDVRYASVEHLLDCEYIVLTTSSESCYKAYAENGENGLHNLIALLEANGYCIYEEMEGSIVIYHKD